MLLQNLIKYFRRSQRDVIEEYLSKSVSLQDLERRQRDLARKGIY